MTLLASDMLRMTRTFAARPERVFDAWLGETWCQWLGPPGAVCRCKAADIRPGGGFAIDMTTGNGRTIGIIGSYRRIDRPAYLELTWVDELHAEEWVIAVNFEAVADGTRMTLQQGPFSDPLEQSAFHEGWTGPGGSFEKLDAILTA